MARHSKAVKAAAHLERLCSEYLLEYEFDDGDGATHKPTDFELLLITDAVAGLLSDNNFKDAVTEWHRAGKEAVK